MSFFFFKSNTTVSVIMYYSTTVKNMGFLEEKNRNSITIFMSRLKSNMME